jgi:hypothetical protein
MVVMICPFDFQDKSVFQELKDLAGQTEKSGKGILHHKHPSPSDIMQLAKYPAANGLG